MDKPEEQPRPVKPPFYQRKEFPPLAVFGGFLLILLLSTAFSGRPPAIDRVTQEDNLASEIVTIDGKNFGAPGAGGEVRIGDLALTPSNYLKWSEDKIVVSIPREISSGIIYVVTKTGKCRGDIYMNPDEIPRLTSYRGPLIESLSAESVAPGRVIVIKGERFGAARGTSRVSFSQIVPMGNRQDERDSSEQLVSASDADLDYIAWSDREIRLRVPEGAKSGLVMAATDKGQSNFKYITVMAAAGRREYNSRAVYRLRAGALVSPTGAESPNWLLLLVPRPVDCPEQRRFAGTGTPVEPLAASRSGLAEMRLTDLAVGVPQRVTLEYSVERYAVNTEIDPALVTAVPDRTSAFSLAFTGDDPVVKPSHPALAAPLAAAAGSEKNPYLTAGRIYAYVIDQMTPDSQSSVQAAPEWYAVLGARTGDALVYAALFTALARKAGLPARLIAGYYVDQSRALHQHYWSEFYIEDFGWVPVDPFLGEGSAYGSSPEASDPKKFYFGNLDNRHLAFAKGFRDLARTDPLSRTVFKPEAGGWQPFHEESGGGLKYYSAAWDTPTVIELK
jgi:transglutaminase-like putative cysteine protease